MDRAIATTSKNCIIALAYRRTCKSLRTSGGMRFKRLGLNARLAKNGGAKQVVNKVQISDEAREKAASNLSSGGRRAQVKRSDVPNRN